MLLKCPYFPKWSISSTSSYQKPNGTFYWIRKAILKFTQNHKRPRTVKEILSKNKSGVSHSLTSKQYKATSLDDQSQPVLWLYTHTHTTLKFMSLATTSHLNYLDPIAYPVSPLECLQDIYTLHVQTHDLPHLTCSSPHLLPPFLEFPNNGMIVLKHGSKFFDASMSLLFESGWGYEYF